MEKTMESDVGTHHVVEIDRIITNGNIRNGFDEKADKELVASIEKHGLLSPLIVRKDGNKLKLIAGHRRLSAMKMLKKDAVPVIVVDASDTAALEIQITENLQRQDLKPVEEAKAFQMLQTVWPDFTLKEIAERADKSLAYVTRSMSLLTLGTKTMDLIERGDLSAEHGHQIARVAGKQRETIEKFATTPQQWSKAYPRLDELKREIEKAVEKDLKKAVFPLDVAKYGGDTMPACSACKFNTGNQDVLFDGATKGHCTNGECYNKRTSHWYGELRKATQTKLGEKVKFVGLATDHGYMGPTANIGGYPIVTETVTAKTTKMVTDKPEKYGFGIIKPYKWDDKKKPRVAIVSMNKAAKPKREQAEPQEDYRRKNHMIAAAHKALVQTAWKNSVEPTQAHLRTLLGFIDENVLDMISEVEGKSLSKVKTLSEADVLWALLIAQCQSWQIQPAEWKPLVPGFDVEKIAKDAAALAGQEYDAKQKLTPAKK